MVIQRGMQVWRHLKSRKLGIILLMLVVGVSLLALVRPFISAQGALPTSRYQLPGLDASVSIFYDGSGMPHILASSERDGYAGLCWAESHDRLFQLDTLRGAAEGRLARVFGRGPNDTILQQDELFRTFDLAQVAQAKYGAASSLVRADMSACATGINAQIAWDKAHQALPPEFADLAYTPELWQPWQCELIALYFASSLDNTIYLSKIERAVLTGMAGSQVATALMPDAPDTPSMFNTQGQFNSLDQFLASSQHIAAPTAAATFTQEDNTLKGTLQNIASLQNQTNNWADALLGGDRASNNFVVGGELTASGKPLLANDPHLQLATPSLLYFAHLTITENAGFDIEGLTIPGFPAFISAHTATISYAITFANLDDADLFVETIRKTDSGEQVLLNDQWVPVTARTETIQVAGAAPDTLTILQTPHGPLLNAALPSLNALGTLALKSVVVQNAWTIEGFFRLPKVQNWGQFQAALGQESIGLNFLYADNTGPHGHIGYQMAGLVPQRSEDNTLFPVSGADGTHEWTSYAAQADLPSVYNPPSHLLATANNRIVPSTYAPHGTPIYLSRYWDLPWRTEEAITLLVQAGNHVTAPALIHIQLSTQTVVGKPIAADIVAVLGRSGLPADDPNAATSFAILRDWNGNASADSSGATLYETMLALLDRDILTSLLGSYAYQAYTQSVFVTTQLQALQGLLEAPDAPFFSAINNTQAPTKRDQAIKTALGEVDALLRTALGNDPASWNWGKLHTLTYNHPLATVDPRFTIGTFPTGGDGGTINTGGWFMEMGLLTLPADQLAQAGGAQAAFQQDALATARVIWDLSNFDRSLGALDTGESGDPTSPHWSDQAALWRSGRYVPLAFTDAAIQQTATGQIILASQL